MPYVLLFTHIQINAWLRRRHNTITSYCTAYTMLILGRDSGILIRLGTLQTVNGFCLPYELSFDLSTDLSKRILFGKQGNRMVSPWY
jgi:hypothetical protein